MFYDSVQTLNSKHTHTHFTQSILEIREIMTVDYKLFEMINIF